MTIVVTTGHWHFCEKNEERKRTKISNKEFNQLRKRNVFKKRTREGNHTQTIISRNWRNGDPFLST